MDNQVDYSSGRNDPDNIRSRRRSFFGKLAAVTAAVVPLKAAHAASKENAMGETDTLKAMQQQIQEMARQIGILEDIHAIRKLQHAYGYYIDKCLYEEVVDLYAEDSTVTFNGGIFKGKAGVRRLYVDMFQQTFTDGRNGPVPGFLLDHPQIQDIVDVAPDRKTAKARFRCLMQAGVHEKSDAPMAKMAREQGRDPMQWWEGGMYENIYVRENGIWKFKHLNYQPIWHADYETGWAYTRPQYVQPFSETWPDNPTGPDELDTNYPGLWPNTDVVAFHYNHPVTGKPWKA